MSVADFWSELVPVAVAVFSAMVWPTVVAIAHEYVHVSPGSSVASAAFSPVRCSSQFASSNTYPTNDVLPVFVTAIVK